MKTGSSCIICETPYNVFNSIKMFYTKDKPRQIDLFLGKNLEYLYDNLKTIGLFSKIYVFNNTGKGNTSKLRSFFYKVFLKRSISNAIKGDYSVRNYDAVYIFSATKFPSDIIYQQKNAQIFYIEDGMDSYIGRICFQQNYSWKSKIINWVLRRDVKRIIPQVVYLNVPELCGSGLAYEVRKIPNANFFIDEINAIFKRVFAYKKTNTYEGKKVIYLGQAFVDDGMGKGVECIEEKISNELLKIDNEIIYRRHPRNKQVLANWNHIDEGENMWELVCQENIDDDSVLISSFSTAMFTPKLLYGKEPWLIYTYRLYEDYFVENNIMTMGLNSGIKKMCEKIKRFYRNPEKVICVEDIDELIRTIKKLVHARTSYV